MKKTYIFKVLIGLCIVLLGVNCGGGDDGGVLSLPSLSGEARRGNVAF